MIKLLTKCLGLIINEATNNQREKKDMHRRKTKERTLDEQGQTKIKASHCTRG